MDALDRMRERYRSMWHISRRAMELAADLACKADSDDLYIKYMEQAVEHTEEARAWYLKWVNAGGNFNDPV